MKKIIKTTNNFYRSMSKFDFDLFVIGGGSGGLGCGRRAARYGARVVNLTF
jgi:glycerol-3-phosphate dehydrogenase